MRRSSPLLAGGVACAALLAVLPVAHAAESTTPSGLRVERFALVVGANDGGAQRARLRYAVQDATSVAEVLNDIGGVPWDHQQLLVEPDGPALESAIDALSEQVQQAEGEGVRTEVLVYYSGHSDEEGLLLGEGLFEYPRLKHALDTIPSDVRIAILDSCSSGALVRTKGGKHRPPFLVDSSTNVTGHAILTSSSANEASQESDKIGGSFFTHYLVSGLRGAADVTGDDRVTLNEAYDYAHDETLRRTENTLSGPQHANYDIDLAGSGDLVMTDLRQADAALVLDADLDGRLFVRDDAGRLRAEILKVRGEPMALALGEGTFNIHRERGALREQAAVTVDTAGGTLTASDFRSVESELAQARGKGTAAAADAKPAPFQVRPTKHHKPAQNLRPGFAFDAVPIRADGYAGAGLVLIGSRRKWVRGVSLGFGVSAITESLEGAQLTVIGNAAADVLGAQSSFVFNTAGSVRGAQLTGIGNLATEVTGLQLSGAFNLASNAKRGGQVSMGLNLMRNSAAFQLASTNIAGGVEGAQIGLVNIGRTVRGAQIGLVNIAGKLTGGQIGIVNVSGAAAGGEAIGVVSIAKRGGRIQPMVFAQPFVPLNVQLKTGVGMVHTLFELGANPWASDNEGLKLVAGLGAGVHLPLHRWVDLDLDLVATSYHDGISAGRDFGIQDPDSADADTTTADFNPIFDGLGGAARLIIAIPISKRFAPFIGVSANIATQHKGSDILLLDGREGVLSRDGMRFWPGGLAGIRF